MTLHDILPIFISILGVFVGLFLLSKIKRLPNDVILVLDFYALAFVNIYVGILYGLFVFGIIPSVEMLSPFIRPANLLQIALPAIITWRMGAR